LAIPLSPRAIEIFVLHRQSVYDSLYIALPEREACELVTADEKMVQKLQPAFSFIVPLSSLP
jgi:predicted nucleic acid-binding protein